MMNLRGKKLVFLGGSGLDACAIERARELGMVTIVANRFDANRSPAKKIADESWDVDFSDIPKMVALIRQKGIDGLFVGWTDSHLPFYANICKEAGLPCCGTPEQFGILSNDKRKFKELCRRHGVPTVKEYPLTLDFFPEDLAKIHYPAIVKPADGSGGRGVKRCDTQDQLILHYRALHDAGATGVVCEEYIGTKQEIFLNYTIVNSVCHLAATYMCFDSKRADGTPGPAILHVYPSSHTKRYQETVEPKVLDMLRDVGIENAILSLQGFVLADGAFAFHETGLRMGGGQSYVFTQTLNGVSALDQMLEFSVTGQISPPALGATDNPYFSKPAVNYYVSLRSGRISEIKGFNEMRAMPQVLLSSVYHRPGDEIVAGTSLDSVIYRLHVMDDTPEALARTLEKISHTLCINDSNGQEMQVERLTRERALEMILAS